MTRRTRTIVTTAASFIICSSGLAFAQQQDPESTRTGGAGASGSMQIGNSQTGATASARASASGDADQQMEQQLRSIAQDPKTAGEKLFVLKAGCGNQQEIEFGRAAQQKAQNQQVKQFAQQLVQDHQAAQQQLQQVAQQLGVQIPQSLPKDKQQEMQILSSMPTEQFEKHFVCMMEADHAKDLIEYRSAAHMAQNEQVKQYAQQTLPKLQQHYEQVQRAAVALGLPSGGPEAMPASGRLQGDMNMGTGSSGDMNSSSRTNTSGRSGTSGTSGSGRTGTGTGSDRNETSPEHAGPTPDTNNPQR